MSNVITCRTDKINQEDKLRIIVYFKDGMNIADIAKKNE